MWRVGDEMGFDHIWVFDHFASIFDDARGPVLEGWTLLAAMAQATRRARIGIMVTGNTYRHPAVLAKMAVTVDHLCGGRLEMGMGAGWAENEHTMLGLPFPPVGERIDRLGEACAVMKALWTEEVADFRGRFYQLSQARAVPRPIQRPYPPLWIGGSGEKKTLRVVAQHADVWNAAGGTPEECARLAAVLDRHCDAVGRDPAAIRRSVQIRFDGSDPGAAIRLSRAYLDHGFSEFIILVTGPDAARHAEVVATMVLPEVRPMVSRPA